MPRGELAPVTMMTLSLARGAVEGGAIDGIVGSVAEDGDAESDARAVLVLVEGEEHDWREAMIRERSGVASFRIQCNCEKRARKTKIWRDLTWGCVKKRRESGF